MSERLSTVHKEDSTDSMPPLVSLQDALKQRHIVFSDVTPIRSYPGDSSSAASSRNNDGVGSLYQRQHVTDDHMKREVKSVLGGVEEGSCKDPSTCDHDPPSRPPRSSQNLTLPPLSKPSSVSTLRRQRSEPVCPQRRAIFNTYWKQGEITSSSSSPRLPSSAVSRPPKLRNRSRSVSMSEDRPGVDLSYRDFVPPLGCSMDSRAHYRSMNNLPSHSEMSLPPLPLPLQRFYSDGRFSSLAGMYPIMVSPKPILRQSSYRNLNLHSCDEDLTVPSLGSFKLPGMTGLNLTRSVSRMVKPMMGESMIKLGDEQDEDTSETASDTTTSSSRGGGGCGSEPRGVSFDPRITVTEFEDSIPRVWFTEADLERFRIETVLVAQKYLLKHPEMIEVYNKPRLDPVTGTMRKKALYSMPALSSVDTEDADSDLVRYRRSMKELSQQEVKNILVVDRNKLILDLFRRSLRTIFPHAQITTAQSSVEALRLFCEAMPRYPTAPRTGFDIVIAEERLHQPLAASGTPVLTTAKSGSQPQGLSVAQVTKKSAPGKAVVRHVRHNSLQSLSTSTQLEGFSGSELLRRILEESHAAQVSSAAEAASWFEPSVGCALLIGVTVNPEQDEPHIRESGADVVWGKPPPSMDERLRDELVGRLIRKRENHKTSCG